VKTPNGQPPDARTEPPARRDDDDLLDAPDDRSHGARFWDWVVDIVRTWGPAMITVLAVRSVIAEPFRIPSGSMVPTLAIGDHILVTKYSYGLRWPLTRIPIGELDVPERGDVVVFVFPGSDEGKAVEYLDLPVPAVGGNAQFGTLDYIKRVVGLPGDTVQVRDNIVYINGAAQARKDGSDFTFVDDGCTKYPTRHYREDLGGVEHSILTSTTYGARVANFGPETVPEGHIFAMGDNRDHSQDSRFWGYVPLRNIKGKARFIWLSYDQCQRDIPLLGALRGERFLLGVE